MTWMALEQEVGQNRNTNGVDGGDEGGKAPRLPRWTRQEILVLIQGKRDAENKFRRGRTAGLPFGSGQVEPKWASVSSYCRKHGVNRGPVQCRKRWSNLAGDYKKIKEWESQIRDETESFWVMRNDLRRERKLAGFFDIILCLNSLLIINYSATLVLNKQMSGTSLSTPFLRPAPPGIFLRPHTKSIRNYCIFH